VGHEIDVTLADLVADVRALTPSEAAERVVPAADEVRDFLARQRARLASALGARLSAARARLDAVAACRVFRRPLERVQLLARRLDELEGRARRGVGGRLERARADVRALAGRLESLSPLAVLARGYSWTTRADGQLVRAAAEVAVGDRLRTRLAAGEITSRVESAGTARAEGPQEETT
jgi:exodeoxyribonuclease VII large subunit